MSLELTLMDPRPERFTILVSAICIKCNRVDKPLRKMLLALIAPRNMGLNALCCIPYHFGVRRDTVYDPALVSIVNISSRALDAVPKGTTLKVTIVDDPEAEKCHCVNNHLGCQVTADIHGCPLFYPIADEWDLDG
jgi:hypothetical protein